MQTAISIMLPARVTVKPETGTFKDHGGAVPNRLPLQLLTKLRAVRVESAVSHGHAREPQRCYAEQAKQRLWFSPSLCTPVYAAV